MAKTYKDHPDVRAIRAARRQRMMDIGARSLLGYGASHDDDPADTAEHAQALAEYIRMGGFVDLGKDDNDSYVNLLLGRKNGGSR